MKKNLAEDLWRRMDDTNKRPEADLNANNHKIKAVLIKISGDQFPDINMNYMMNAYFLECTSQDPTRSGLII